MLRIARRIGREVYPASVFTGVSGDTGPRLVATLRKIIAEIDALAPKEKPDGD